MKEGNKVNKDNSVCSRRLLLPGDHVDIEDTAEMKAEKLNEAEMFPLFFSPTTAPTLKGTEVEERESVCV